MDTKPEEAMAVYVTFVVRVARDPDGRLAGVVERVRTGEKWRFEDAHALGRFIEQMVDEEMPAPERPPGGAGELD